MVNSTRRQLLGVLVISIIGSFSHPVQGADLPKRPFPKGYVCGKTMSPLQIDGVLDPKEWNIAPWTEDFTDIEGDKKPPPRFRTRAKMLWDESFFYIAAELTEPNIWGTLREHDKVIFQDNDFEVFLDPDGDNHAYYELEINALNTTWDLLLEKPYRDGGPAVNAWEIPGMKTAVKVHGTLNDPTDRDTSWTVEIALPWSVLGARTRRQAPPRDGDQWRINFSRVEWEVIVEGTVTKKVRNRREDNWVWSPQGVIDMHQPERWGFVQFTNSPPDKIPFRLADDWLDRELLMRIYHAQRQYRDAHGNWAKSLNNLELGEDAKTAGSVIMTLSKKGFNATITREGIDGKPRRILSVREDSLLTQD